MNGLCCFVALPSMSPAEGLRDDASAMGKVVQGCRDKVLYLVCYFILSCNMPMGL